MNCQTIRETIDTASRRAGYGDSVHTHLAGCVDCRRHANEMSSLLALLNDQPRIEASPDFEFRLRARIARTEAEPELSTGLLLAGWGKFWSRSFSLGQAAAAMATIAVMVTASSFYFTNSNEMATPSSSPVVAAAIKLPDQTLVNPVAETLVNQARPVRPATRPASSRASRPQALQPAGLPTSGSKAPAGVDMSSFYANGRVNQIASNRDLIGAEAASLKSQPALSF
jgi:hypothetical protein